MKKVICFVLLAAAAAFAGDTAAYLFGMVGVFAGKYESDADAYEMITGYHAYEGYTPPIPYDFPLSSTDFAASPFGFALKADAWRASFVSFWNRHKIDQTGVTEDRQLNNAALTATGGYILNRGFFADQRFKPYFGGFWRGCWTKAENVNNGVLANGFGPDLGAVVEFGPNRSFGLFTFGYQYKIYTMTGSKWDNPIGDDPPEAPYWNYTYIPEDALVKSGSSIYFSGKSSFQFTTHFGAELELRYDLDLNDTFVNGLNFAAGPNVWL